MNALKEKGHCECRTPECVDAMGNPGRFGKLGRPDRRGRRHVPGCEESGCRVCTGLESKRKGGRRQAKAATALGIPRSSLRPGNEESYGGAVRLEVKSGKKAKPVLTAHYLAEAQSEAQRPIGDHRPFVAVFEPDDVSYGLVVIRTDRLAETVAALVEQLGMVP